MLFPIWDIATEICSQKKKKKQDKQWISRERQNSATKTKSM